MKRFIEGENRSQATLFPERLEEYIAEDSAIPVVDAFVNKLDLQRYGCLRSKADTRNQASQVSYAW
jgi:hypothetical protein